FIEVVPRTDVQTGNGPGHSELRERKQIGEIDVAPDFDGHELRRVADQYRKQEVVNKKEDKSGNDEDLFRGHEILELVTGGHTVPHGLGILVRLCCVWHRYPRQDIS